jgi:hypothetical protein
VNEGRVNAGITDYNCKGASNAGIPNYQCIHGIIRGTPLGLAGVHVVVIIDTFRHDNRCLQSGSWKWLTVRRGRLITSSPGHGGINTVLPVRRDSD